MRWLLAVPFVALLTACFPLGDSRPNYASRREIIAAAERCGVPNFVPQEAGTAWSAQVSHDVEDWHAKEDCIYNDIHGQGMIAPRYQCLAQPSDPRPNCLDYE
jgi:hypothetical protein